MNDLPERALAAVEKYGGWEGVLAALKDAERYRWLRNSSDPDKEEPYVSIHEQNSWGNWVNTHEAGDELDELIDAAMAGANSQDNPRPEGASD